MESPHFSPCATPDTYIQKNECTLGWDSLSYTVTRRGQDPKVILSNVSGRAAPGELVAIMGPSGSGKTTLLDILADRISTGQVTGQIHLNGRPRHAKTFRLLSSYVSQEDALTGSFTVLETLRFAARLSVPANTQLTADRSRADFPSLSKADLREIKPSVGRQFAMLLQRTALENVRNPGIFWIRFVMFLVLSAMTGTLYLNDDKKLTDMDYVALLFGAPAFTTFLSVAALPFFLEQRAVFARERANSGLNVGAFTIATFVAALPGLALLAITATLMVVPMTGLHGFGTFFWIMFLSLTVAESLMSVLGVLVSNAIMGIALGAAALGMFMLTEGFMVPRPSIQHYWLWGHYLGFHTYSFEALVANQFQGVDTVGAKAILARFDVADVHVSSHASILIGYALILQVIVGSLLYKLHTGRR
ncbi:hypothetical protein DYB32_002746 [Aphanomyces invadans]|uniref:AAA+ ATPase domain-containing protein n=1 Tax=Aphanomyces invadans TaxID=157072 RepID=A0A418B2K3_9STRA|nr:hypothetical protein DYB32_002746 [Aphanomyces invadans]